MVVQHRVAKQHCMWLWQEMNLRPILPCQGSTTGKLSMGTSHVIPRAVLMISRWPNKPLCV